MDKSCECSANCGGLVKGKNSRYVPGHNPNSRLIDLTGGRFGKLLVLHKVVKSNRSAAYWLCRCDCGNEIIATGWVLQHKNYKSCGKCKLPPGEANFNRKFSAYVKNAKNRGIIFKLTKEDFKRITKENCFYCGSEPKQEMKSKTHKGSYLYNGLDRVNPKKGYIIDNVVPCCWCCNYSKRDRSSEEFIQWIDKIYNFLKDKI